MKVWPLELILLTLKITNPMKIRYTITYKPDGTQPRQMYNGNQANNFFDTKQAAEQHMADMLANNSLDSLHQIFTRYGVETFAVRPYNCYEYGEAESQDFPKSIFTVKEMDGGFMVGLPTRSTTKSGYSNLKAHKILHSCAEYRGENEDGIFTDYFVKNNGLYTDVQHFGRKFAEIFEYLTGADYAIIF